RRGLEHEPRSPVGQADLALGLRLTDDKAPATAAAARAMALAPRDGTLGAVAGTIFEWAEMNDEAVDAYARAVTHDASLVQSPFWASTPFRLASRVDAIARSLLKDCQKARNSAIFAGFRDDLASWADGCRRQVEASPGDARARSDLAVVLFA